LEQIIRNTKVKPEHRAVFLGTVGKVMVAALIGVGIVSCAKYTPTLGISPDEVRKQQMADANDPNDPHAVDPNLPPDEDPPSWQGVSRGISPD
jgi:hypothetical protein